MPDDEAVVRKVRVRCFRIHKSADIEEAEWGRIAGACRGVGGLARPAGANGEGRRAGNTAAAGWTYAVIPYFNAIAGGPNVYEVKNLCPDLGWKSSKGEWLRWKCSRACETKGSKFCKLT